MFNNQTLEEFLNCDYDQLYLYHFTLGIRIRNDILKKNSILYNLFYEQGVTCKDDMSFLMIQLFYFDLHGKKL